MDAVKTLFKFMLVVSVYVLSACQQPGNIDTSVAGGAEMSQAESANQIPSDVSNGGTSGSDSNIPSQGIVASTEECGLFLKSSSERMSTANVDRLISGESRNVIVDNAKNISIIGNSGSLNIYASVRANQVSGNSGKIFLISKEILEMDRNSSSEICVRAAVIHLIRGNSADLSVVADLIDQISGGSGDNRITANSINLVEGNSSLLHIYKAHVMMIRGQSGTVCLHDGAQVIGLENSSAVIRNDCP